MKLLVPILYPSLLLGLFFSPLSAEEAEEAEEFTLPSEAAANLSLSLAKTETRAIARSVRASGTVLLDETRVVEVVPRIAGIVEKDHVQLGDMVEPGTPLIQLESAELSEAITSYVEAEQEMRFALRALQQEQKLSEQQLSSAEQLRDRERAFDQAVAGHDRALQPLKLLHFTESSLHQYLEQAREHNYTQLEITARTKGEIINKQLRRGEAVEPGRTLLTIADLSRLWVDFRVALRDIGGLSKGDRIEVSSTVDILEREATIHYIAPLADQRTRTVLVRAILDNPDGAWRPGTPVTVITSGVRGERALTVPNGALVDYRGGKAVFVRLEEGRFRIVPVETGDSDEDFTAVTGDLLPGAAVVRGNAAMLKSHLEMTADE